MKICKYLMIKFAKYYLHDNDDDVCLCKNEFLDDAKGPPSYTFKKMDAAQRCHSFALLCISVIRFESLKTCVRSSIDLFALEKWTFVSSLAQNFNGAAQ